MKKNGILSWATYVGGKGIDNISSIDCQYCSILTSGSPTSSDNISSIDAPQLISGGMRDTFLAKYTEDVQKQWGTFYGGSADETPFSSVWGNVGGIFLVGSTYSTDGIKHAPALQDAYQGKGDGFIAYLLENATAINPFTINDREFSLNYTVKTNEIILSITSNKDNLHIIVYDILGRELYETISLVHNGEIVMPMNRCAKGMNILRISSAIHSKDIVFFNPE